MFWNIRQFNRELNLLKQLPKEELLHPLKSEQIKQAVLAQIAGQTATKSQIIPNQVVVNIFRYLAVALAGLLVLGGTAWAANYSRPGDLLFPIKKAQEKIELNLAVSEQTQIQLHQRFAQERLDELVSINADLEHAKATSTLPNHRVVQAKIQAETEVNDSITTLQTVKAQLEAKGNIVAASSIDTTILRLQDKLDESRQGQDDQPGGKNKHQGEVEGLQTSATSSLNSGLRIDTSGQNHDSGPDHKTLLPNSPNENGHDD